MESNFPIAKFDLSLTAAEVEEGLLLTFVYRTDLFDSLTMNPWLNILGTG